MQRQPRVRDSAPTAHADSLNDTRTRPREARSPSASGRGDRIALVLLLAIPAAITVAGLSYYLAPRGERVRSALHPLLKPSGSVGLVLGIFGLALFLFMWLYPLRKHWRALAWTGGLPSWLRVHTVAGLVVPAVVAVHAGWRFEGVIGLGYFAMLLVSLSGIVGRFLYVHIPRGQAGLELSLDEVANERRAIVTRIAAATGMLPAGVERMLAPETAPGARLGTGAAMVHLVTSDFSRARAAALLRRRLEEQRPGATPLDRAAVDDVLRLARREMALAQQVRVVDATRRLFGLWHVAHRPVAITALLAVVIHVVVTVAVGAIGFAGARL